MSNESKDPIGTMTADEGAPLSEELQTDACLYAAGALAADERIRFEASMEKAPALLAYTTEIQEVATAVFLDSLPSTQSAPPSLKPRVLHSIDVKLEVARLMGVYLRDPSEAAVLTDDAGLVLWVDAAFTTMCGYTLDELRGRKPGSLLQGPLTDQRAVAALRQAICAGTSCREELINYHKDGHPYWVAISLSPIYGPDGAARVHRD